MSPELLSRDHPVRPVIAPGQAGIEVECQGLLAHRVVGEGLVVLGRAVGAQEDHPGQAVQFVIGFFDGLVLGVHGHDHVVAGIPGEGPDIAPRVAALDLAAQSVAFEGGGSGVDDKHQW